ncbi:hypothetical protein RRG08_001593 [Elysia crispata]|uniref:Uncharacterized protein n=1 Tax=Elysia crispata TaxID=231223 RepID=A0AAE1AK46_9GAST|nr:hypothetical protein RRG08_001593 [Elysia crispata]
MWLVRLPVYQKKPLDERFEPHATPIRERQAPLKSFTSTRDNNYFRVARVLLPGLSAQLGAACCSAQCDQPDLCFCKSRRNFIVASPGVTTVSHITRPGQTSSPALTPSQPAHTEDLWSSPGGTRSFHLLGNNFPGGPLILRTGGAALTDPGVCAVSSITGRDRGPGSRHPATYAVLTVRFPPGESSYTPPGEELTATTRQGRAATHQLVRFLEKDRVNGY